MENKDNFLHFPLSGKRIVVTGCGYKPVQRVFYDVITGEPSHDVLSIGGIEQKLNIGAATAHILAERGAAVHMVSTSQNKESNLSSYGWQN